MIEATEASQSRLAIITESGVFKYVDGSKTTPLTRFHMKTMRGFADDHACIGARTLSTRGKGFYMSLYPDMTSVMSALMMIEDLEEYYVHSDENIDDHIKTLAAIFPNHAVYNQEQFARDYWYFAQKLHDVDCLCNPYDPLVSSNPHDDNFELSLAGRGVFTTTLNPQSPRISRRAGFPVWVMNQSAQFQTLRDLDKFETWQMKIRRIDASYDPSGMANPILMDHGYASAKDQLAGSAPIFFDFTTRNSTAEKLQAFNGLIKNAHEEGAHENCIKALTARAKKGGII